METDLRRIEEMVAEIVTEMEYLRTREQKLRDTNESTNERVKWFAFGTMGMLVGLGVWQVVYLRAYFRFVPLSFYISTSFPPNLWLYLISFLLFLGGIYPVWMFELCINGLFSTLLDRSISSRNLSTLARPYPCP